MQSYNHPLAQVFVDLPLAANAVVRCFSHELFAVLLGQQSANCGQLRKILRRLPMLSPAVPVCMTS